MKVGVMKGIAETAHCKLCGGNSSTGCLNPEFPGSSLEECPANRENQNKPAFGGR
jgi:hypothetical protein